MEQEFRMSTGMKVLYCLMAAIPIFIPLIVLSLHNGALHPLGLLCIAVLLLFAVTILVNAFRKKIVLTDDTIVYVNIFSKKTLATNAVKGCRIERQGISIEPLDPKGPQITIRFSDFENGEVIKKWVTDRFVDLNPGDLEMEHNKVLQNPAWGTPERAAKKLKQAKGIAAAYSIAGVLLTFVMIFVDNSVGTIFFLFYPVLGLLVIITSRGLIKFVSERNKSANAHVMIGFTPCFLLLIKSFDKYDISQVKFLWLPALITTVAFLALLYIGGINKAIGKFGVQVGAMLIFALMYGFGSTRTVNCMFDSSVGQIYKVEVTHKRYTSGKNTVYYLTLSPWGARQNDNEVDIHRGLYDSVAIGDTVKVRLRDGLLHIPWFVVTKE